MTGWFKCFLVCRNHWPTNHVHDHVSFCARSRRWGDYWLELLGESGFVPEERLAAVKKETGELKVYSSASLETQKPNHKAQTGNSALPVYPLYFCLYPLPGYGHGDFPERFTVFGRSLGLGYIIKRKVEDAYSRQEAFMTNQPSVVHRDPEILGGTPVFVGTRVPLRNLFDYLERGHDIDEFLDAFPSVSREQAIAVLENAHEALTADARPAR
jgi:uncharacterized protein (DUF433 family)